jgi:hypothetical protein
MEEILAHGFILIGVAVTLVLVGWMLNEYVLVVLSSLGDLLVGVRTLYLKSIVALVIPGAIALYDIFKELGLTIDDCSPGFRVSSWALQLAFNG